MSEKIVQLNEEIIKEQIKELIRGPAGSKVSPATIIERNKESLYPYWGLAEQAVMRIGDGIEEPLSYCDFSAGHWIRIHINNEIERLNREIRHRTRMARTFPDGHSTPMLVCARLRHVAGASWGNKKYMNMMLLETALEDASLDG